MAVGLASVVAGDEVESLGASVAPAPEVAASDAPVPMAPPSPQATIATISSAAATVRRTRPSMVAAMLQPCLMQRANGLDGVRLVGGLVVPVADHPREPQRHAGRIP